MFSSFLSILTSWKYFGIEFLLMFGITGIFLSWNSFDVDIRDADMEYCKIAGVCMW